MIRNKHNKLKLQIEQERMNSEIKECTFTPKVRQLPQFFDFMPKTSQGSTNKKIDFISKEEQELQECTFHPKTNTHRKLFTTKSLNNNNKQKNNKNKQKIRHVLKHKQSKNYSELFSKYLKQYHGICPVPENSTLSLSTQSQSSCDINDNDNHNDNDNESSFLSFHSQSDNNTSDEIYYTPQQLSEL